MSNEVHTTVVIFGASGDLTQRKLVPSLFNLFRKQRMRPPLRIVGHSKTEFTDEQFRLHLWEGLKQHATFAYTREEWDVFAALIGYHSGGYDATTDFASLDAFLSKNDAGNGQPSVLHGHAAGRIPPNHRAPWSNGPAGGTGWVAENRR